MSDCQIVSDNNFDEVVLKAKLPVLVDFWAPWCGPCMAIAPTLDDLAKEYQGRAIVSKMNVDENANTPSVYGVRSIPYFILVNNGEVVDTLVGASKEKLTSMLEKVVVSAN